MEHAADICLKEIVKQPKRPLFVGIAGDSGSGKSYLAHLLEKKLAEMHIAYTAINHDDFLISRTDREPMKQAFYTKGKFAGKSHWEILENMFRLDDYKRVLSDLKMGKRTSYLPYLRETGTVARQERIVVPRDYIICDTSMLLGEMDFVILVDVSQENIIRRKLVRDSDIRTPEQIVDMHKKVQGYYWGDRGKPTHADIIIDNNDFNNVKVTVNSSLL